MPIKAIARVLGISRNTVRAALASDGPPRYERALQGSIVAGDERLTLAEVQTILRHAHLDTTGRYLTARIEDMHDKLTERYNRPRPEPVYAAGYDPDDIKAVFGA